MVDKDRNGVIDRNELAQALLMAGEDASPRNVDLIMQMFDFDRNGVLDFNEFSQVVGFLKRAKQMYYDYSRGGSLSPSLLPSVLSPLFPSMTQTQLSITSKGFAGNSPSIDLDKFTKMALKTALMNTLYERQSTGLGLPTQYGYSKMMYGGGGLDSFLSYFVSNKPYKIMYRTFQGY